MATLHLGHGFTLEPALDVGISPLENSASYRGAAAILQPFLDGVLFNWDVAAWLVTPSIDLEWATAIDDAKRSARGHLARSWIDTFGETDVVLAFREAVNVYSIDADYSRPFGVRLFDRPLYWVARAGYFGFFGENRSALGFSSVAEIGGGLELPVSTDARDGKRLRLVGAYLFGPDVHGWTVGLTLRF